MAYYYEINQVFMFTHTDGKVVSLFPKRQQSMKCKDCYFGPITEACLKHDCGEALRKDNRDVIFVEASNE